MTDARKPETDYEAEIDAIRLKLYEETKNLTVEERVERANSQARELAARYGFKIAKSARREPKVLPPGAWGRPDAPCPLCGATAAFPPAPRESPARTAPGCAWRGSGLRPLPLSAFSGNGNKTARPRSARPRP